MLYFEKAWWSIFFVEILRSFQLRLNSWEKEMLSTVLEILPKRSFIIWDPGVQCNVLNRRWTKEKNLNRVNKHLTKVLSTLIINLKHFYFKFWKMKNRGAFSKWLVLCNEQWTINISQKWLNNEQINHKFLLNNEHILNMVKQWTNQP